MSLISNRKILVLIAAIASSYLLFDYFHGSEKIGYGRLEAEYGVYSMIFGEIVPIGIMLLAAMYSTKKVDD